MYKITIRGKAGLRRSRRGNMPFAIIAVTLLILSSAYIAISSQITKSEDNGDNIGAELESVGKAEDDTKAFIERGLGEIVFSLSTKTAEGTVEERIAKYTARADEWMKFQFPSVNNGVKVTIQSFETKLRMESLRLAAQGDDDGSAPVFFVATGMFKAMYSCGSGSAVKETQYETDASCALPLIAGQGSLFKNALGGTGSALFQMVEYQLSALAQYRVLNGYGSISEYGAMGTTSILTEKDVVTAYSNSIKVLGLIDFRCAPEGLPAESKQVDLADFLIGGDGSVTIDMSAAYSQALLSVADDIILRWFDYLMGNAVLDLADKAVDVFSNALDSFGSFITGKNRFSAAPYIESVLKANGMPVNKYRHHMTGERFTLTVPESAIGGLVGKLPEGKTLAEFNASIPYPSADLMSWKGISDFKRQYRAENNDLRERITWIINKAAVDIGASKPFGTITVNVDPADGESFFDSITSAVRSVLTDSNSKIEKVFVSAIKSQKIPDPFYCAIFEEIRDNLYSIYGVSSFEAHTKRCLEESIKSHIHDTYGVNAGDVSSAVSEAMSAFPGIESEYRASTDSLLEGFASLCDTEKRDGFLSIALTEMVKKGLGYLGIFTSIPKRVIGLCEEMSKNLQINAASGPIPLPGTDRFDLSDGQGRKYIENVDMGFSSQPKISVLGPNSGVKNMHYVGFNDSTGASYCTIFTVKISDCIKYTAKSSGTAESAMGISDSELSDSVSVNMEMQIGVASGWALMGVNNYEPSNTLFGDAWNLLITVLEPILGPLRKVVSMILDALSVLGSAIMEVARFMTDVVKRLYNALMEPLEMLRQMIEDTLDRWISDTADFMLDKIKAIVKVGLDKQTVGFSYMGFSLMFTLNVASLTKNVKTLVKVEMGCDVFGVAVKGSLTVKQKGEGSSRETMLSGSASLKGKDWAVAATIDPTMKSTKRLIHLEGTIRGVDIDVVLPELVQYNELEMSICDIPGVGAMLSNIPLPIPGLKASIDVGLNLKYRAPFCNGLVINEFEQNPEGDDRGREWVELYNASDTGMCLAGFTLSAGSNPKTKSILIGEETIAPKGRVVIDLPGVFLNNASSSKLKGGEYVILKDRDGEEVDRTPKKTDDANDGHTWQRIADGAFEWVFENGTYDSPNCGGLVSGAMVKTAVLKVLTDSAVDTLSDMGTLKSMDDLSKFFQVAVQNAITTMIEMIAGCLVEASIFLSIDVTDATGTGGGGFRAALMVDNDFAENGLKCLVGEIEALLFNMGNPYGISPKDVLLNDVYLDVRVYAGISTPKFLGNTDMFPKTKLTVDIRANIAGLGRIVGCQDGEWKVVAGVMISDCPTALIPSALNPDRTMSSDLWLIKAVFEEHA